MFVKAFGLALLWLAIAVSSAAGQTQPEADYEEGRLNIWTTGSVYREYTGGGASDVKIRVGTHNGYDRMVFEFKGYVPTFNVYYAKRPVEANGEEPVRNIRGKAVLEIEFIPINYSEKNYNTPVDLEKSSRPNLRTRLIKDVRSLGWWEGEIDYVIGIKERRPFRIQVLSNPMRLVIDFKS